MYIYLISCVHTFTLMLSLRILYLKFQMLLKYFKNNVVELSRNIYKSIFASCFSNNNLLVEKCLPLNISYIYRS